MNPWDFCKNVLMSFNIEIGSFLNLIFKIETSLEMIRSFVLDYNFNSTELQKK